MKHISMIIQALLLVAVAVLFILYFGLKSQLVKNEGGVSDVPVLQTPATITGSGAGDLKTARIAYVNIDSLDINYQFIIDNSKEMRARQAGIEAQYNSMVAKFQNDYAELQQAAQAGMRSEAELTREKGRLEQMQYDIASKEKQMQGLGEEASKRQAEMLKGVSSFISKLNNGRYDYILAYTSNISSVLYARPGLDITKEVVDGLNQEYAIQKNKLGRKKQP